MNKRRLVQGASVLAAVTLLLFWGIYQWSATWLEEARPGVVQQLSASLGGFARYRAANCGAGRSDFTDRAAHRGEAKSIAGLGAVGTG